MLVDGIDQVVADIKKYSEESDGGYLVEVPIVLNLLREVYKSLEFDDSVKWDLKSVLAVIEHLSKISSDTGLQNKVWVIIRVGMNMSRTREDGRYSDDPDGGRAEGASRSVARKLAIDIPAVILTRQNGNEERGWRGTPFWWPVIVAPKNTPTSIFANEIIEN